MYLTERSEDSLIFGFKINGARVHAATWTVNANRCLIGRKSWPIVLASLWISEQVSEGLPVRSSTQPRPNLLP